MSFSDSYSLVASVYIPPKLHLADFFALRTFYKDRDLVLGLFS